MKELRSLYGTLLEKKGPFEVVAEAGDGRSGIKAAEEHQPDLVLLDLSMPDMDGLEALPEIKDVSPEADVVVLSGFLDDRVGREARELGAADYLEKGMDADEMLERVSQAAEVDLDVERMGEAEPGDAGATLDEV